MASGWQTNECQGLAFLHSELNSLSRNNLQSAGGKYWSISLDLVFNYKWPVLGSSTLTCTLGLWQTLHITSPGASGGPAMQTGVLWLHLPFSTFGPRPGVALRPNDRVFTEPALVVWSCGSKRACKKLQLELTLTMGVQASSRESAGQSHPGLLLEQESVGSHTQNSYLLKREDGDC